MANLRSEVEQSIANQAKTLNLKRGYGKDLKQGKPIRDGGDIDVFPSQGDKVLYVDYMEGKQKEITSMIQNLKNQFGAYADPDVTKSSYRLKLGNKKRNKTDIVNFRILKSGNRTPTAIQERGSNYILNLALGVKKGMKKYNFGDSAQNIFSSLRC